MLGNKLLNCRHTNAVLQNLKNFEIYYKETNSNHGQVEILLQGFGRLVNQSILIGIH